MSENVLNWIAEELKRQIGPGWPQFLKTLKISPHLIKETLEEDLEQIMQQAVMAKREMIYSYDSNDTANLIVAHLQKKFLAELEAVPA